MKTHDPYCFFFRNKRVIYLVRDGRDAVTSYLHYLRAKGNQNVQLRDLVGPTPIEPAGTWSSHVCGWQKGKCKEKVFLRYDDLTSDTFSEVSRLM